MKGVMRFSLTAFFVCAYLLLRAQPLPPEGVPIDGGLVSILLLGAGGALAAKKIRDKRKGG